MYDVVIVGAGVSGSAVARELARTNARVCVVEREEDVCCGTSKANSAIVHAGFDAQAGSLMAKLNVEGNALMWELAQKLDFKVKQCGSLVVCTSEEGIEGLNELLERGRANGVPNLRIVYRDELVQMEPNISDAAVAALWAPSAGIVDAFGLNIALAENAAQNGVEFRFNAPVKGLERTDDGTWIVLTGDGKSLHTRCVVNAAGVYSDVIHNMASDEKIRIIPRKGEYLLLDTTAGNHVSHTIFMLPTKMGKGVLVSPTVHGNLLVGPTAADVDDPEATDTTRAGLDEVASKCALTVANVPLREVITSFAGLRAHQEGHEFIIGMVDDAPGFVDCAAIESPGLTSCPAIGKMVAGIVAEYLGLDDKPESEWIDRREGIPMLEGEPIERWAELAEHDKAYGNVICRCRHVTEAQILAAIHRPLGAHSLDAVKRRVTAGMGRCQGGFCSPKVMELLERELGMAPEEVTKCGPGSELLVEEGGECRA
ncbi:MAG: NAD(P)/FAD-dependent oxidoreductase [Coriobacteriales bacterium]|nr:NAD(P)/FAD-dependent oxidoreductase [Coriobacteriales bacterium]